MELEEILRARELDLLRDLRAAVLRLEGMPQPELKQLLELAKAAQAVFESLRNAR